MSDHVHSFGPDFLCICGASPIDVVEGLYAEARAERDEAREQVRKAEAVLRLIADQDYRGNEPADRSLARRYFEKTSS